MSDPKPTVDAASCSAPQVDRSFNGSLALRLERHHLKTRQRLEANREAALREVDEPTFRVWRLHMAACALEFESGGTGIYQILASSRNQGEWPVPLSRGDLYAGRDENTRVLSQVSGKFPCVMRAMFPDPSM